MRQRMVKPDFFASETLGACRPESRLAFIGLWIQADDRGNLKCQFGRLRRQIFPYDAITDMSFAYLLAELESVGCIQAYTVADEHYICIPNFLSYQTIQRPSKSTIPAPTTTATVTNIIPSWIAELWPVKDVENPVDNSTLNECSMSTHSKERKKGRSIYLEDTSSSQVNGEGAAVDNSQPCPPHIAANFRKIFGL